MRNQQLTRFIIVGLSTNGILLAFFWLLVDLGVPSLVGVTVTYALGLVASLLLNGRWTFGALKRENAIGSTIRFSTLYAFGYLYSLASFWLLSLTGMPHLIDQFMVMASCAVLLFLGQKYWVFRKADK